MISPDPGPDILAQKTSIATRARWTARLASEALSQRRFPFRPVRLQERAQSERVRAAVAYGYEHVPHYRETMLRLGLRPNDFQSAADLERLPLIERGQVQRDPEYFTSQAQPLDSYVRVRSGGSTGEPITLFRDRASLFMAKAQDERFRHVVQKLTGRRLLYRNAVIEWTEPRKRDSGYRPFRLVKQIIEKRLWLHQQAPISENLDRLNEFQPHVITCTGAYVGALFSHVAATGGDLAKPNVVVYYSDAVPDPIRRHVTERLGIHLLSTYGAIETWQIGFECEQHSGHHLNFDLCPIRIVDPDGRTVADGESGEVVASDLANRGTMLLNYRLGDLAARLPENCSCGRNLPMLSLLEGRADDTLIRVDGSIVQPRAVHRMMKPERGLWGWQVVQDAPGRLRVSLVPAPNCDRETARRRVGGGFTQLLGDGARVEVSFVDSLPRTKRGKLRPVVSHLGPPPGDPG
jgi:phenylacetate-CoA ligase